LAAQNGYVLAAPSWGIGLRKYYQGAARDRALVVDTLRDLRRRFQVDSDRVFLFGLEQGGLLAWDVGLAHPDQFAGVLPMSAGPYLHGLKCWSNAQYLPFYVVSGERTGKIAVDIRRVFKSWVRWNYPGFYVEYKGRSADWFSAEPPLMMDWMNRKKRLHPIRDLGRETEEYKTVRTTDNRFYWLSTDEIDPRSLYKEGPPVSNPPPASMWAMISTSTQTQQIQVRTRGLNKVTVWLGPGMINYAEGVSLRLNGATLWNNRKITPSIDVLLENLYEQGDRQRLYWARLDFKLAR
jgi:hypothetical protein